MARITKRDRLTAIYAILADRGEAELADFVAGEVALLDKRANAPRKATKTQRENIALKGDIVDTLGAGEATATQVAKANGVTVQKATALLKQLVDAGLIERAQDGKTVTFKVA